MFHHAYYILYRLRCYFVPHLTKPICPFMNSDFLCPFIFTTTDRLGCSIGGLCPSGSEPWDRDRARCFVPKIAWLRLRLNELH